jgi:hypothetical protein
MMPKPPSTWKAVERWYAVDLGVERNSKHGQGENVPDICPGLADIEVKHGKQIPQTILRFVRQAVANCLAGRIPVVIMHAPYQPYEDGLVIMRYKDWKEHCTVWRTDDTR